MAYYNLIIISLLFSLSSFGQSDTLNQKDAQGKKQGFWIITGEMKPEKGYCASCKIEEGTYLDDRKNGTWHKYYLEGGVRLEGTYVNNRPNGFYKKFYQSGCVMEMGNFDTQCRSNYELFNDDCNHNKSRFGTKKRKRDKFGNLEQKSIAELEFGDTIKYFFSDSTLEYSAWRVGVEVHAFWYYQCKELRTKIIFDTLAHMLTKEEFERSKECEEYIVNTEGEGGPRGEMCVTKGGAIFKSEGYNKVYNKNDELWLDGEFRRSRLWNGKLYKYDSDGILLKVEIWKSGKYHSDGQI
ncbi:MAG: antitoxin component YwqK of YwqJK toxin-antitoxin module [Arenicella sp.]|jgi:antitoxin component YwqK of YwqJK toxin-antitoxin module